MPSISMLLIYLHVFCVVATTGILLLGDLSLFKGLIEELVKLFRAGYMAVSQEICMGMSWGETNAEKPQYIISASRNSKPNTQ